MQHSQADRSILVAAVDVGGTSIKGSLVAGDGDCTTSHRTRVTGLVPEAIVSAAFAMFSELLAEANSVGRTVGALGLAIPGLVDEHRGVGRLSMILGWRDVPFGRILQDTFGLPVAFSHDVSAGAYAQARRGPAVGHDDWLFIALGTGVGSTFILGGRPYRGIGGTGGELAHVICEPDGPVCRCGKRGCLEMVSSAEAVATLYREATGRSTSAADVAARAEAGEPNARLVWDRAVAGLTAVLGGYIESLNPSVVVVGGGLAQAGDLLFRPVRAALNDQVAFARPRPTLHAAAFGDLAAVHGIAIRAHERLAQEAPVDRLAVPFDDVPCDNLPFNKGNSLLPYTDLLSDRSRPPREAPP